VDLVVSGVISRLLQGDPEKAVPWLNRFKRPDNSLAQEFRSQVAVRLAGRDLAQAVRLAEGIGDPVYRGLTRARLATTARKADPALALGLIEKAAADIMAESKEEDHEPGQQMGVAIYLLWQAKAVAYPDLASLVAMALATRPPVQVQENASELCQSQRLQLAAGVGSLDPAAGRALLGPDRNQPGPEDEEESPHQWFIALAVVDPAAAARHVNGNLSPHTAETMLAILKQRSSVIGRLGLLHRLGWVWAEGDQVE
jgi:hypothetical protein